MPRYFATIRFLLLTAGAVLAGCSSSANVRVEQQFPTVVAMPREYHAALIFDEAFRNYSAAPSAKIHIDMGTAQVDLLSKAFRGLFSRVDVLSSKAELQPGTDLVIIPSVREVQLSVPSESYLNVYEVWIKYSLDIETADGVPIDRWFMPAYGKTPDSVLLSRGRAIEGATVVALRDAGAKLLLDFYRIPAIHVWLEQRALAAES